MSVPDLPFVGQKHWGSPLNTGIEARTSSDYLADKLAEDGPFRSSLMSTIDTRIGDGLNADPRLRDTGWRRLPGGTLVRRIGAGVYVNFYGNLPAGTGTVEPDTLPPGFRPRWHSGVAYFLGNDLRRCHVLNTGILRFYDVSTSGAFVTMSDHFATDNNWPTTLPGSPV